MGIRLVTSSLFSAILAPSLIYISPLEKLSEWAIHFFTVEVGFEEGINLVHRC